MNPDQATKVQKEKNSVDPDQLTSEEASWSGSTQFSKQDICWVKQNNC